MTDLERLIRELPDAEAARSFYARLEAERPRDATRLRVDTSLLSDVLTLVSYSPLLATTLIQNPEYISWLGRERRLAGVRPKSELFESLARFALTNSTLDPHALFARFRRRELLKIFLADIRRLATVAEVTDNISNLADAVLEHALMLARQKVDNLFGHPLDRDHKGRARPAGFCIVSLGKLGSRELNYSSDIDLIFIYSADGATDDSGSRAGVTNKEYFARLSEEIVRLVGRQEGEGAAYRVDMRLRPNGSLGPLALSLNETIEYYKTAARDWERQVLIRSRASAGDVELYSKFFEVEEHRVFSREVSPAEALRAVKRSKKRIDDSRKNIDSFDVKLGRGGIREIEFIAQALQLAYGGRDRWLRAPHTLISLSRLTEHGYLDPRELTELHDAYAFLRRLEHILQMEHGLQTHELPNDPIKRSAVARKMNCDTPEALNSELERHAGNVSRVFDRVFGGDLSGYEPSNVESSRLHGPRPSSIEGGGDSNPEPLSPHLAAVLSKAFVRSRDNETAERRETGNVGRELIDMVARENDFSGRLIALRVEWTNRLADIINAELTGTTSLAEVKAAQTRLAEASIGAALETARREMNSRLSVGIGELPIAVLAFGKLASGGLDYESDLDVVLTYDDDAPPPDESAPVEFYSRAAEYFVTALSGVTRHGNLYRVDLRLRPHGKNGPTVASASALIDYVGNSAAIWELLAYVKLRGVPESNVFSMQVEHEVTEAVFTRAATIPSEELAAETRRVRGRLEKERAGHRETDIKYGEGGILDIYFAARFLQLRDRVRDEADERSTSASLRRLYEYGSLEEQDYKAFTDGYGFLSALDHAIRFVHGRATKLPVGNVKAMNAVADRMECGSSSDIVERLSLHRISVRDAFDRVVVVRG